MKFTFKTEKSTGKYRSFYQDYHYVKFEKKVVGNISDSKPHRIRLMVMKDGKKYNDENPNCTWMWIMLKAKFDSIDEAKAFLNRNIKAILAKNLYQQED